MSMMDQPVPLTRTNYEGKDDESVTRPESRTDMADYHRHLESLHNAGLHGWGIASGLQVSATLGETGVRVAPGIAVQGNQIQGEEAVVVGKHISLAYDGYAVIGEDDRPIKVAADGVRLSTDGLTGVKYLAIQFYEFFDQDTCLEKNICNIHQAPRLRLLDVEPVPNDGTWLVLARIDLDAHGKVLALSTASRHLPDLPAGSLQLWQASTTATANTVTVEHAPAGELTGRQQGGLNLTVANPTDELHLGAQTGNMARLSLAAEQIVATRAGDNQETIHLNSENGELTLGGQGVAGTLHVTDATGNATIALHNGEAELATLTASGTIAAGSLSTTGGAEVGTLTVSGNSTLANTVIKGELSSTSTVRLTGSSEVGTLTVSGNSTLANTVIKGELSSTSTVRLLGASVEFKPGEGTEYQAKTDGFVFGMAWGHGSIWVAGAATFPNQLLVQDGHILLPVQKGDHWSAGFVSPGGSLFTWTPLGSPPSPADTFEKVSNRASGKKMLPQPVQTQHDETSQDIAGLVDVLESLLQNPGQNQGREQLTRALQKLFHVTGNES